MKATELFEAKEKRDEVKLKLVNLAKSLISKKPVYFHQAQN